MGKVKRVRTPKPCNQCGVENDVLFRVRTAGNMPWQLICKACQMKAKNEMGYEYGGTWKQNKRN